MLSAYPAFWEVVPGTASFKKLECYGGVLLRFSKYNQQKAR
jgi:hypothetical protein